LCGPQGAMAATWTDDLSSASVYIDLWPTWNWLSKLVKDQYKILAHKRSLIIPPFLVAKLRNTISLQIWYILPIRLYWRSRAWWLMLVILLLEGKVLEAYGGTWGSYHGGLGILRPRGWCLALGTGHATLKPVTVSEMTVLLFMLVFQVHISWNEFPVQG
jgi:hypothetical protein